MMLHTMPSAMHVFPETFANGGSDPRVCDFDDMVLRLVKWHPSNHGITATYSELVASRIGQLFDAPIMRGTVVHVDPALLPPPIAARVNQPYHVGFTFAPGQNFSVADYGTIKNSTALPAAAVHLSWLQVGDQQGHNQYLCQLEQVLPDKSTRAMNHFILIDQAQMFGYADWCGAPLDTPASDYVLPPHMKDKVAANLADAVVQQVQSIAEQDVRACFSGYPPTWAIPAAQVERAVTYLLDRRAHLGAIMHKALQ